MLWSLEYDPAGRCRLPLNKQVVIIFSSRPSSPASAMQIQAAAIFLLLSCTLPVVTAFPTGAGACHVGEPSPFGFHLVTANNRTVVNGSLADGGFKVFVNGQSLDSRIKGTVLKLRPRVPHTLQIVGTNGTFKGVLMAVTPTLADADVEVIAKDNTTLGPSAACLAQNVTDTQGVTHLSRDPKTNAASIITSWNATTLQLDLNVVVANNVNESYYYYSQTTVQVTACRTPNQSCTRSNECCMGKACLRSTKTAPRGVCTGCKAGGRRCFNACECCQGFNCLRRPGSGNKLFCQRPLPT